jgi:hypothetical protein
MDDFTSYGPSLLFMIKGMCIKWVHNLHIYGKRKKPLVIKLYTLFKHVSYQKCKVSILSLDVAQYFMNKNSIDFKNKQFYIVSDMPFVLDLF